MKNTLNPHVIHSRIVTLLIALSCLSTSTITFSAVPKTKDHFSIGAAAVVNTEPYEGFDGFVTPMPLFDIQYGDFFLFNNDDEPVIGLEILRGVSVTLSIAATYGRTFLDVGEINDNRKFLYFGISNRDRSIDFGFNAKYYGPVGLIEATLYRDVSGKSNGIRSSLSISKAVPDTGKWSFVPSFFAKYYSRAFNDYYYGVSDAENDAGVIELFSQPNNTNTKADYLKRRPSYNAGTSGHLGIDLNVAYSFTQHIKAKAYIAYENYTGPVETSPLTEDKALIIASFGFSYDF